jgi:hypothetical protein
MGWGSVERLNNARDIGSQIMEGNPSEWSCTARNTPRIHGNGTEACGDQGSHKVSEILRTPRP